MDFVLRIYASLLSTLTMTLIAVSLNGEDFHIFYGHGTEHHAALGFMLISSACEFVHILCVYFIISDHYICHDSRCNSYRSLEYSQMIIDPSIMHIDQTNDEYR